MQIYKEEQNYSYIVYQGSNPDPSYLYKPDFFNFVENIYKMVDISDFYICIINVAKIYNTTDWSHVSDISECYEYLKNCQKIAAKNNKTFLIVLDNVFEIPSYIDNYKEIIDNLTEYLNITHKQISIFSITFDYNNKVKHITNYFPSIDYFKFYLHRYNYSTNPQHHFVCLARRPRPVRVFTITQILDKNLERYGRISLGSMSDVDSAIPQHAQARLLLPEKYHARYPFLLDGYIDNFKDQFGNHPNITGALFNLVIETAADKNSANSFWSAPGMSEKTTKAFAAGQIPIFVTPYKTLHHIRALGFDLFDDIIDHSYDTQTIQYFRVMKAVEQLEKMCDKPIEYWQEWKQANISRFEKNYNRLKFFMENHREITKLQLEQYLNDVKFQFNNNVLDVLEPLPQSFEITPVETVEITEISNQLKIAVTNIPVEHKNRKQLYEEWKASR